MNEYQVGDTVVMVGKAPDYEFKNGQVVWISELENLVGKHGKIKRSKDEFGDYTVCFREDDNSGYWINESWLAPQFKVGDRVIVHRPETEKGQSEYPYWNSGMDLYNGTKQTILRLTRNGNVVIENTYCFFHPRWLELVKEEHVHTPRFAVGDLVKVTKPTEKKPRELEWLVSMRNGLVGKIVKEAPAKVRYMIDGDLFWYDPAWLTKVEDEQSEPERVKHSKFTVQCQLAEMFDWGISVEGFVVEAYIRKYEYAHGAYEAKEFYNDDFLEEAYTKAFKWLVKQAKRLSPEFKAWYEGA